MLRVAGAVIGSVGCCLAIQELSKPFYSDGPEALSRPRPFLCPLRSI
jgi:hypothetical protein